MQKAILKTQRTVKPSLALPGSLKEMMVKSMVAIKMSQKRGFENISIIDQLLFTV